MGGIRRDSRSFDVGHGSANSDGMRRVIECIGHTGWTAAGAAIVGSAALLAGLAAGCATPVEPKPAPVAEVEAKPDVDPRELCLVKAEIDDAMSRLELAEVRARYERDAAASRAARFGALLTIQNEQDRFRAFHDDSVANPNSAVGPLGECFVYAGWKMADQASGRCQMAEDRLRSGAVVEVARAELHRRKGALDAALGAVERALALDGTCAAAHIEAARVHQARGDDEQALGAWERARATWPRCYLCLVEAAKLKETRAGKDAALPLWEEALALQPDSLEALKRYAAALAGVDDAKALEAYERAIGAGGSDVATFMGAAQLAAAGGASQADKALGFAERAAAAQPNDIDAWRLILALAQQKGDGVKATAAANEVLRLVGEDLPALLALARDARANGRLVDAVLRYDAAARAIAGGRTAAVAAADLEAAGKEHAALLAELKVATRPAVGSANSVISSVQRTVQALFVERLKKLPAAKKGTLRGSIEVGVTVSAAGAVDDVEIVKDTLGDPAVTASLVANLRRATVTGGAKRYAFQMDFQ